MVLLNYVLEKGTTLKNMVCKTKDNFLKLLIENLKRKLELRITQRLKNFKMKFMYLKGNLKIKKK